MRKILSIAILSAIALLSTQSYAQCNDGWFTNRVSIYAASGTLTGVGAAYSFVYNFSNYISAGTEFSAITYSCNTSIPICICMRIRPYGHHNIMPSATISTGYSINTQDINSAMIWPRISMETGRLVKAINFATDIGYYISKYQKSVTIGVSLLF